MIVEFETLRTVYYTAKIRKYPHPEIIELPNKYSEPTRGDLVPIAEKLKNLAREIWNLRYTKSSEFQFPDAAHEQIITTWKAQFEMWTDIHEDHCDPVYSKSAADLDAQNDYPKLAGLSLGSPAPIKKTTKKIAAAATPAEGEEASRKLNILLICAIILNPCSLSLVFWGPTLRRPNIFFVEHLY